MTKENKTVNETFDNLSEKVLAVCAERDQLFQQNQQLQQKVKELEEDKVIGNEALVVMAEANKSRDEEIADLRSQLSTAQQLLETADREHEGDLNMICNELNYSGPSELSCILDEIIKLKGMQQKLLEALKLLPVPQVEGLLFGKNVFISYEKLVGETIIIKEQFMKWVEQVKLARQDFSKEVE